MLFIWYNTNYGTFFVRYSTDIFMEVGHVNGYGHILVQILVFSNRKLLSVNSYQYVYRVNKFKRFKKSFIKRVIRFLNKF